MKIIKLALALVFGIVLSVLMMDLPGQKKKALIQGGVVYMEADQSVTFLENGRDTRRLETEVDESIDIEDSKVGQLWYYLDYVEGSTGFWVEYMNWDDSGSFNTPSKFFGPYTFTGNVSSSYEVSVLQAMFYESSEAGDIGVGLVGLRQELSINSTERATEKLDALMPSLRWRYVANVTDSFYYRLEAQYMSWLDEVKGHDLMGEIGYDHQFNDQYGRSGLGSERLKVAVGYRQFKAKGKIDHGEIDVKFDGPYVRLEVGTDF